MTEYHQDKDGEDEQATRDDEGQQSIMHGSRGLHQSGAVGLAYTQQQS